MWALKRGGLLIEVVSWAGLTVYSRDVNLQWWRSLKN